MVRYTSQDKDRLLALLREERAEGRCMIVKRLKDDSTKLVVEQEKEIIEKDQEIEQARRKVAELEREKNTMVRKKDQILKDAKLFFFDVNRGSCTIHDINPELMIFDTESREKEREILNLPVR